MPALLAPPNATPQLLHAAVNPPSLAILSGTWLPSKLTSLWMLTANTSIHVSPARQLFKSFSILRVQLNNWVITKICWRIWKLRADASLTYCSRAGGTCWCQSCPSARWTTPLLEIFKKSKEISMISQENWWNYPESLNEKPIPISLPAALPKRSEQPHTDGPPAGGTSPWAPITVPVLSLPAASDSRYSSLAAHFPAACLLACFLNLMFFQKKTTKLSSFFWSTIPELPCILSVLRNKKLMCVLVIRGTSQNVFQ